MSVFIFMKILSMDVSKAVTRLKLFIHPNLPTKPTFFFIFEKFSLLLKNDNETLEEPTTSIFSSSCETCLLMKFLKFSFQQMIFLYMVKFHLI